MQAYLKEEEERKKSSPTGRDRCWKARGVDGDEGEKGKKRCSLAVVEYHEKKNRK